jgi:septum formation protein
MAVNPPNLVLASRSPRRRELLAAAGYTFEVCPPSEAAEEGEKGTGSICAQHRAPTAGWSGRSGKWCLSPFLRKETPAELVARLARQKAADVARRIDRGLVLGCDTVVECGGRILGKPADEEHARAMLRTLSGQAHRVLSGVCLMAACGAGVSPVGEKGTGTICAKHRAPTAGWSGRSGKWRLSPFLPTTEPIVRVAVTTLRMDDLTPEQLEGYLASGQWEGKAGAFGYQDGLDWVHVVEGSESNVVGLPMELLAEMLESYGKKKSDTDFPKPPWYRPHRSTFLALALVAALLVLLVAPGRLASLGWNGTVFTADLEHGWPWLFLRHTTAVGKGLDLGPAPPWRVSECWQFTSVGPGKSHFLAWRFVLDVLVALAIAVSAAIAFEWWRRRRLKAWQFSLRELFLLTLAVAAVGAWYRTNRQETDRQTQIGSLIESELTRNKDSHFQPEYCGPKWLLRLIDSDNLGFLRRPTELRMWPHEELKRIRSHIGGLPDLREGRFVGASVTDADLAALAQLPRLKLLSLQWGKLEGVQWSILGNCNRLRVLNLAMSDITDDGLRQAASLDSVRKLSIPYTKVTAKGLRHLRAMKNLEALIISDASDECLDAIVCLKNLRTLRILVDDVNFCVQRNMHPSRKLSGVDIRYECTSRKFVEQIKGMSPLVQSNYVDFMEDGANEEE